MKNLKSIFAAIIVIAILFTSCKKDEMLVPEKQTSTTVLVQAPAPLLTDSIRVQISQINPSVDGNRISMRIVKNINTFYYNTIPDTTVLGIGALTLSGYPVNLIGIDTTFSISTGDSLRIDMHKYTYEGIPSNPSDYQMRLKITKNGIPLIDTINLDIVYKKHF